jgi:hypothetical protein
MLSGDVPHGSEGCFVTRTAISGATPGNGTGVDTRRMIQAPLAGWRGTLAERVARPVARRTQLSADTVRSAVGAVFLLLALRTVLRTLRAGLR